MSTLNFTDLDYRLLFAREVRLERDAFDLVARIVWEYSAMNQTVEAGFDADPIWIMASLSVTGNVDM